MCDLTAKVAVITGASRGIGQGIALSFAKHGARLVVNATSQESILDTMEQLCSLGTQAVAVIGDIAEAETSERLVEQALHSYGSLDIAVSCAGINMDGMLHKMTDEQWKRVLDVDLTAAFYLLRSASKVMRRQGSGRILTISSAAWLGNLGQANYAAAKAGLVALTNTAARELGRYHITCNTICPGLIETDMTANMPARAREEIFRRIPLQHMGNPQDIGNAAVFLASEAAAYITGEVLNVGGGLIL